MPGRRHYQGFTLIPGGAAVIISHCKKNGAYSTSPGYPSIIRYLRPLDNDHIFNCRWSSRKVWWLILAKPSPATASAGVSDI